MAIGIVLLAFAFVFALFASLGVGNFGRLNNGWFSIALLIASMLFGRLL